MCFPPIFSFLFSVPNIFCLNVHLEKLKVLFIWQTFRENIVYFLLVHFFETTANNVQ